MTKDRKKRRNLNKRDFIAKDLLESRLYRRKIFEDRKKLDKKIHKEYNDDM